MKTAACIAVVLTAFGLVAAYPLFAQDRDAEVGGLHARIAQLLHQREGIDHAGRIEKQLGLSEEQKEAIADILAARAGSFRQQVDGWLDAREAQLAAVRAPTFDEAAVREASRAVARLEEDLAVEAARLLNEIGATLTPEQRVQVAEHCPHLLARIREHLPLVRERIADWIERHGGGQ
ncbi:MAG: Spy/CpxP family protein refolding chaperone [Planctomycetes bacterium]|nr:Spy/CpxP family protein refolding chaperone [Planctomycetota bacterium]